MIKLKDLLKEEGDTFTAINKSTGILTAFKSKSNKDAAVKAGTHSEKEDADGDDSKEEKPKPNMFSKKAGYDAPEDDEDEDDDEYDDEDEDDEDEDEDDDSIEKLPQEIEAEFENELGSFGFDGGDAGALEGVTQFLDDDGNMINISAGSVYDDEKPFAVSGYNEDDDSETNYDSFDSKEEAIEYAKELAKKLKGGNPKRESKKPTSSKLIDLLGEVTDKETYHKSFSKAAEAAENFAGKRGYEINQDDWQSEVAMGGKNVRSRPSVGKTTRFTVGLLKNGKPQRKALHFQVYGMKNGYELTTYIN